jgi:hypothetical protein
VFAAPLVYSKDEINLHRSFLAKGEAVTKYRHIVRLLWLNIERWLPLRLAYKGNDKTYVTHWLRIAARALAWPASIDIPAEVIVNGL